MKSPITEQEWTAERIWEALCWGQEGYPKWGTEGYRQWRKRFDKVADAINKELETAKREHAKQFAAEQAAAVYERGQRLRIERERNQLREQLDAERERKIEEVWKLYKGVDPETGEAWLTPRMERDARVIELTWKLDAAVEALKLVQDAGESIPLRIQRATDAVLAKLGEGK